MSKHTSSTPSVQTPLVATTKEIIISSSRTTLIVQRWLAVFIDCSILKNAIGPRLSSNIITGA